MNLKQDTKLVQLTLRAFLNDYEFVASLYVPTDFARVTVLSSKFT